MNIFKKVRGLKSVGGRYFLLILVCALLVVGLYIFYFLISSSAFNKSVMDELYRESERAAYDIEQHIKGNVKALAAVGSFIEIDEESYALSRLKETQNDFDCYMLGILDRDGYFKNTDNEEIYVGGIGCFGRVLEGETVKGESFVYGGKSYVMYGVPVYRGNVVRGGLCCLDDTESFGSIFFSSDYLSFAFVSGGKTVIAESRDFMEAGQNLGNILSKENMEKYDAAVSEPSEGGAVLPEQKINNKAARILVTPLSFNNCVLLTAITNSDYNKSLAAHLRLATILYGAFLLILVWTLAGAWVYFKKSNRAMTEQLGRFTDASKTLKIVFIKHSHERPGHIYYCSDSVNTVFGYSGTEGDLSFINRLEPLIYSEDRSSAFRSFEDFYSSGETNRRIYFRLVSGKKVLGSFADDLSKDPETGELVSLLSPVEEQAMLQQNTEVLNRRLELISRVSEYYIFDLNLKNRELYTSENLKERLGYVISGEDCFRSSVRERLIHPHSLKELEAMVRSYKRGVRHISGNLTVKTSFGSFARFHTEAEVIGSIIKEEVRITAILKEV